MMKGQMVTVRLYGGSVAERRVVAEKGDVVVICSEDEYQDSLREGREPSGVGFPQTDVVESTGVRRKSPKPEINQEAERSKAGD